MTYHLFASDVRLPFLAAKYFVAFVGVNLFACVVFLFCGFCFGSYFSKEKKKGTRGAQKRVRL
jgi:hypothetical protein